MCTNLCANSLASVLINELKRIEGSTHMYICMRLVTHLCACTCVVLPSHIR